MVEEPIARLVGRCDCQAAMIELFLRDHHDKLSEKQQENWQIQLNLMLEARDRLLALKEQNFALRVQIIRDRKNAAHMQHTVDNLLGLNNLQ